MASDGDKKKKAQGGESAGDDLSRLCLTVKDGDQILLADGLIRIDVKKSKGSSRPMLCITAPRALKVTRNKEPKKP